MTHYLTEAELEGAVRVLNGDPAEVREAARAARDDFVGRLEQNGLTVLPAFRKQWWKAAR